MAAMTLQQTRHLIVATDGLILLFDENGDCLRPIASFGEEMPKLPPFARGQGIVGAVAASGIGEIRQRHRTRSAACNRPYDDPRPDSCAVESRRTSYRGDLPRQHVVDGLHRGGTEAAEHARPADGDRDRERTVVRAHDSGGAGARTADGPASGHGSGTRQAAERARSRGTHPDGPVSGLAAIACGL
jgi:hypothetical protein